MAIQTQSRLLVDPAGPEPEPDQSTPATNNATPRNRAVCILRAQVPRGRGQCTSTDVLLSDRGMPTASKTMPTTMKKTPEMWPMVLGALFPLGSAWLSLADA